MRDLNIYLSSLEQSTINDGGFKFSVLPCIQNDVINYLKAEAKRNDTKNFSEIIKTNFSMIALVFLSIMSLIWCIFKKPRFGLYTVDIISGPHFSDPRIAGVYEYLDSQYRRAGFVEFVHAVVTRDTFYKFFKRCRPVIYLEALDYVISIWLKLFHFKIGKHELADLEFKLSIARLRVKILSFIYKFIGIKKLLTIDDYRFFQSFVVAAKISKIQSIAFQHGRFNESIAYLKYEGIDTSLNYAIPDYSCVWNNFWRDRLTSLYPVYTYNKDKVIVAGSPRSALSFESVSGLINKKSEDNISLLFVYEPHSIEYIKNVISEIKKSNNLNLFLKLRPDIDQKIQVSNLGLSADDTFKILNDWHDIINQIDIAVGAYSTFLYECIGYGVPVIGIECPKLEIRDLIEQGVAVSIKQSDFNYGNVLAGFQKIKSVVDEKKSLFVSKSLDYQKLNSILR